MGAQQRVERAWVLAGIRWLFLELGEGVLQALQGFAEPRGGGRPADQATQVGKVCPVGLAGGRVEGRGRVLVVEVDQHVGGQREALAANGVQAVAGVGRRPGGQGGQQ
ncbi:hypothetical protein D3C81_1195810 [compost metagenome]